MAKHARNGCGASNLFLAEIESARGVAALVVAIGHTMGGTLIVDFSRSPFEQPTPRDALLDFASVVLNPSAAVTFFFVVSGLVIGLSLDQSRASAAFGYVRFLLRRAFRIYPAHVACIIGIIALGWLLMAEPVDFSANPMLTPQWTRWMNGATFHPLKWTSVVGNLALLGWSLNLVAWSLYVELCAAPPLPLLHALTRRRSAGLDFTTFALLVLIAAATWGKLSFCYLFAFHLGMLIPTLGRRCADWMITKIGGAGRAVFLCYALLMLPDALAEESAPIEILEALFAFALVSVLADAAGTPALAVLRRRSLRWLGRVSYSFYLWHLIVLVIMTRWIHQALPKEIIQDYDLVLFAGVLSLSVAVAGLIGHLSYRFVERPGIALGRRLAARIPAGAWIDTGRVEIGRG